MTAFVPIAPMKAVEFFEAAGIADARRVIVDFAAAGLLKSYALMIETTQQDGDRAQVRGATVPSDLWQRIIRESAVDDVWTGGTVRLAAITPEVRITGIGFAEKQLQRIVTQHHGTPTSQQPKTHAKALRAIKPEEASTLEAIVLPRVRAQARPAATPIEADPILVTVKQAMAMLGLGRTKVSELMKSGRLVRRHIDGGVRIEVASIRALAGLPAN